MIKEELVKNYKKALEQKYNAICFDIDGTLTEDNSKKIDARIIPLLAKILKRHTPIVFITGRGETGLNDLLKDIIYDLKDKYEVTDKQLLKMYALTNDGARIFMTTDNSNSLFNTNEYISKKEDFLKLNEINEKILRIVNASELNKYCKITYSKDSKTNTIINIRIILETNNKKISDEVVNIINNLIKSTNNKNLNLTFGVHDGKKVMQIGTATKNKAIEIAEKIIGIPQNSMLRIGDCGSEEGNDYSMLNCEQGFSVGTRSQDDDKCFPVIENNKIITGVNGTIALLNKVKLLPTICLEYANEFDYMKKYAEIERKMKKGKNTRILFYNNLVNQKYDSDGLGGIYSIYDHSSGSVKIPLYEWIDIDNDNPLKKLWEKKYSNNLCYSMFDNENILFRGSKTYYYFLSQRDHDKITKKDTTTRKMVNEWLDNNIEFFNESIRAINKTKYINDPNNAIMILGLIDNLRNNMLILLNQQIFTYNSQQNVLLNLEALPKNSLINKLYKNLLNINTLMKNITFDKYYKFNNKEITNTIEEVRKINEEFKIKFNKESEKENYSKEFRAYRELDNFAENYITCSLTTQKVDKLIEKGVCGICYGGLELPIIMKSITDDLEDVAVLKFNNSAVGYSTRQSLELRFFDIYKHGGIKTLGIDKNKEYILLDDNLLTGKTMQLALTTFYDLGIDTHKIISARYPGVNRVNQMFMPNHGAIDYRYFFNYIEGLYFPSPYSRKDPYSENIYEDSLGIFDLNRRKILECIIKNGDYSQNSEATICKRKVKI